MTQTKIVNPTCEYRTNPLGIDVTTPRLSWQLETARQGARQSAYRILASSNREALEGGNAELWDSGRVESDTSVHIPYGGDTLRSRQRMYWRVTVWDETGAAAESDVSWFEMGLLSRDDWQASWVGAALTGGARSSVPVPFLRTVFRAARPRSFLRGFTLRRSDFTSAASTACACR